MDIKEYLNKKKALVEEALDGYLSPGMAYPDTLRESMRYSIFAGGKRIRPALTLMSADLFDENPEEFLPAACSVEMIHTYSLVHDDLPAMDDDDFRRGKPTNHRIYGEGMAILAGDALLTLAFELLTRRLVTEDPQVNLSVLGELSRAAGGEGMIAGQVVDLESEGKVVKPATLHYIHTRKTGALIRAAVRVGGLIGGASSREMEALTRYGESLGLAFQVLDDILDVVGDEKKLGKQTGRDSAQEKATYPALYGLPAAEKELQRLHGESLRAVEIFGSRGRLLNLIADFLVKRDY